MKKRWFFCFVVLLMLLLSGTKKKPPEVFRVVTHMDIVCHHDSGVSCWTYTRPEKMEAVLNYLRLCQNLGAANVDPERLSGKTYRIDICLSDGTHYIYYQRGDKYLSRRCHAWQKVDPRQRAAFSVLLERMPSDAPVETRRGETQQPQPAPQQAKGLPRGYAYPKPSSHQRKK